MDDQRFEELVQKRDTSGLTEEEANELGRMMAEREGRPYSSASDREHPEGEPDQEKPYSEAEVQELKHHPEVHEQTEDSEKAS
jgi:hypothetical protein